MVLNLSTKKLTNYMDFMFNGYKYLTNKVDKIEHIFPSITVDFELEEDYIIWYYTI